MGHPLDYTPTDNTPPEARERHGIELNVSARGEKHEHDAGPGEVCGCAYARGEPPADALRAIVDINDEFSRRLAAADLGGKDGSQHSR